MKRLKTLKPLNKSIIKYNFIGFDIETYGDKNEFLMGSMVSDDYIKTFWDKKKMIDFIMTRSRMRNSFIVATNLGFDSLALFNHTDVMKNFYPLIKSSNMIYLKIPLGNRHYLRFIDTFSFFKGSVKTLGEIIGINKLEKPKRLGFIPESEKEKKYLEKYNIQDALISKSFMDFLQKGFNDMGGQLKITLASTSMDTYRRKFMKKIYYQPERKYIKYLYNGYYGGRTEAIKRGRIHNLKYYDVNSLYPFAMLREYPDPDRCFYTKKVKLKTIRDYEGVAKVRIISPNCYIPYLPYRLDTKAEKKLLFPVGSFVGYYTFFELRKALELGYTIEKFYNAFVYTKTFYPFRDYVKTLYKKRKEFKKIKDKRELVMKIMLNSLYGKFAQKIDKKETIVPVDKMPIEEIKKHENITRVGNFFIINESYKKIPSFVNPIFSIYTTAYARDILYKYLNRCPRDDIYYYDTDSLFTKKYFETSKDLGGLKLEYTIKDGIIIKPKMYMIDNKPKCKGVFNLTDKSFIDILDDNPIELMKFTKFKESNRRGLAYNQKIVFEKVISLEDNKRLWEKPFSKDILQDSSPISIS